MVVSGFDPYYAQTERAGVILTPWAMPLTLGFGEILLGGK